MKAILIQRHVSIDTALQDLTPPTPDEPWELAGPVVVIKRDPEGMSRGGVYVLVPWQRRKDRTTFEERRRAAEAKAQLQDEGAPPPYKLDTWIEMLSVAGWARRALEMWETGADEGPDWQHAQRMLKAHLDRVREATCEEPPSPHHLAVWGEKNAIVGFARQLVHMWENDKDGKSEWNHAIEMVKSHLERIELIKAGKA